MPEKKKHTKHINMQRSQHFTGIYRIYFLLFFTRPPRSSYNFISSKVTKKRAPKQSRKANIKCFGKIFFSSLFIVIAEANNNFNFNFSRFLWWWHVDVLHVEPIWIFHKGSSSSSSAEEKKIQIE